MNRRLLALALVVLGTVSLLSACGGKGKCPPTTAPEGFTIVCDADNGIAIAYPTDWKRIPLSGDSEDFIRTQNSLRLENPKLADALQVAESVRDNNGTFMAVDGEGTSNANLTVYKAQEDSIAETAGLVTERLPQRGATDLVTENLTVAGEPAVRLRYKFPVTTDAGVVTTSQTQYLVEKDDKTYFLTVVGDDPALADTIAETLRIR